MNTGKVPQNNELFEKNCIKLHINYLITKKIKKNKKNKGSEEGSINLAHTVTTLSLPKAMRYLVIN